MGNTPRRPDTADPALHEMIERYVRAALKETGTASARPRERLARGSEGPSPCVSEVPPARASEAAIVRFVEPSPPPPPPDLAARDAIELARELEAAMSVAAPREFVDETPTDLSDPPFLVADDEESTGVYARPPG